MQRGTLPSTQLPRLQLTRPVCLAQPGQTHLRRATFASTVYTPSTTPHACTRSRPALARLLTLPSPLRPLPIVASRTPPQRTFGGPYLLTLEQGLLALEQGLLALASWPWSPGPCLRTSRSAEVPARLSAPHRCLCWRSQLTSVVASAAATSAATSAATASPAQPIAAHGVRAASLAVSLGASPALALEYSREQRRSTPAAASRRHA